MKKFLFLICVLVAPLAYSTVDVLYVNHNTKQYMWGDSDSPVGFISWEAVHDGDAERVEKEVIEKHYGKTSFPFQEEALFAMMGFVTITLIFLGLKARLKQ